MKPVDTVRPLPQRLALACCVVGLVLSLVACGGLNPFRTDRQVSVYRNQLAKNPKDADALYNLGVRYYQLGKHMEALDAFEDRLTLTPEDPDTLYYTGLCYHELGRLSDATEIYRSLMLIDKPLSEKLFKVLY